MARRIINRKEKRAEYDAAERRKSDEEVDEAEEEVEEEDEEEGEEGGDEEGEEAEESDADEDEVGDDDDEEAPKKKKPKPKPKAPAKPKRTRTPKITRMKVVWVVFNNSNQRVAEFEYPKKKDADDLAAKLTADKKNTHFVQPVKIPMEDAGTAKAAKA